MDIGALANYSIAQLAALLNARQQEVLLASISVAATFIQQLQAEDQLQQASQNQTACDNPNANANHLNLSLNNNTNNQNMKPQNLNLSQNNLSNNNTASLKLAQHLLQLNEQQVQQQQQQQQDLSLHQRQQDDNMTNDDDDDDDDDDVGDLDDTQNNTQIKLSKSFHSNHNNSHHQNQPQHDTLDTSDSMDSYEEHNSTADPQTLRTIKHFADELKHRRKSIRLSQKGAAQSLRAFTGGEHPCTDAIIYHFENLQLEPERAIELIPLLRDWLIWAEKHRHDGKQLPMMVAVTKVPRERKRKVVLFNEKAKQHLEDAFAKNNHPDRYALDVIAEELNIPTRSIRKWFTNRRQKKRFHQKFDEKTDTY